jgi:hypothetical protein
MMLKLILKSIELHKYILQMFKWFKFFFEKHKSLKNSNMVNNDYFDSNSIDCGWTKVLKIG